jgi:hypothetical protein
VNVLRSRPGPQPRSSRSKGGGTSMARNSVDVLAHVVVARAFPVGLRLFVEMRQGA